jgi:hypothetical protein
MSNVEDNEVNGFEEFDNGMPESADAAASAPANRGFITAIGVMAGIFILGLVALAGYWVLGRGALANARAAEAAAIESTNAAIALAATNTSEAISQAATAKAAPTRTTAATNTPVIVVATNTPRPTNTLIPAADDPARTATVAAFLTQSAQGTQSTFAPTSTALPSTGFADEVGLPGLFAVGLILLAVVFVARRLRLGS